MNRSTIAFRVLLHCYPAAFRREYGEQMLAMFSEQLRDAHESGGRAAAASLWIRAAVDAVTVAPREHCHVILHDIRYALRTLAAKPTFTAVAALSLALGIGANAALFSLWKGMLHASLPGVREPGQLVILTNPNDSGSWTGRWEGSTDGPRAWLTYSEFEQLRDHADSFSGLMASQSSFGRWPVRIDGGSDESVNGRLVSGGYFEVLGARPSIGRLFTASDDAVAAPNVVISYAYWQQRFGGRDAAIGKTVMFRKTPFTIVGVTAPAFIGETAGQAPDVWLPLRLQSAVLPGRDLLHDTPPTKSMWLHAFGRLKPGVTLAAAEAQVNALFQADLIAFYGDAAQGERRREFLDQHLRLAPAARGASSARGELSESLTALFVAVGVLLLIACANLASLLLARGAARRTEIAVRLSLGASRERLVRQLMTESLTLSAIGGAAALAIAPIVHALVVAMLARSDRRFRLDFTFDPIVLAFVVLATVGTALLFGVLPAWQVTRTSALDGLKAQMRGSVGGRGHLRMGRWLVSVQLALSLPLLVGAGLLMRTVYNLQHADLGFPSDRLALFRVEFEDLAADNAAGIDRATADVLERMQRLPGVRGVTFSELGILSGGESSNSIAVEGFAPQTDRDRGSNLDSVGPSYFSTLGIPIVRGREILASDVASGPRVCVVNETFAERFFKDRDPIGLRITAINEKGPNNSCQVIGVARDAHTMNVRGDIVPRYFIPTAQDDNRPRSPTFLIRTISAPSAVVTAAGQAVAGMGDGLSVDYAESLEERMVPITAQDRTTAQLAMVFGSLALILAAVGLYGSLSNGVARRTGEIALRIALGAQATRVIAMILRESLAIVAVGLLMGAGLAFATSRLVDSRLYGVAPRDPLTLAAACSLLLTVALIAAYVPAARASKVDPMRSLRQE